MNMRKYKTMKNFNIPLVKNNFNDSHIISIHIGNSIKCNKIFNEMLYKHGHYVQPINYPTVPINTERFRVTIQPDHTKQQILDFAKCLKNVLNSINN